jgi:hypothetical protein
MRLCTVEGCGRPFRAKGFCMKHYDKAKSLKTLPPTPSMEERFWAKVDKTGDCWLWTAYLANTGYGQFGIGDKVYSSHRVSYEMAHGKIPEGMVIDHRCHVRACVNPDHLRVVSQKQNAEHRSGPQVNNRSSGVLGVTWHKDTNKWAARVSNRGTHHHLGLFSDLAEAEAAVIAKRLELFTHNDVDRRAA